MGKLYAVDKSKIAKPELSWVEWNIIEDILIRGIKEKWFTNLTEKGYEKVIKIHRKILPQAGAYTLGFTYCGEPKMKRG